MNVFKKIERHAGRRWLIHCSLLMMCVWWMISSSSVAFQTAIESISFWWNRVLPIQFPVLLIGWIGYQSMQPLFARLRPNHQVMMAGLLLGSPAAGVVLTEMCSAGRLHLQNIDRLIAGSFVHQPLLLIVILQLFQDNLGLVQITAILISYYLSFVIVRWLFPAPIERTTLDFCKTVSPSMGALLSRAVREAGSFTLKTGATLLFCHVLIGMVSDLTGNWLPSSVNVSFSLRALVDGPVALLIEQTPYLTLPILSALAAWGGVGSHLLLKMNMIHVPMRYHLFVRVRLIQMMTAALICGSFLFLFGQ